MKIKKLFTTSMLMAVMIAVVVLVFGSVFTVVPAKAYAATEVSAETLSAEIDGENNAITSEENNVVEQTTPTTENKPTPDFWGRIEEWFSVNFLEFISSVDLVAMAACIFSVILERKSNKKFVNETKTALNSNTNTVTANTASNDKVLEVVNVLIDGFNAIKEKDIERDKIMARLSSENKAMLEILATVYTNNKNIPQAVKDLITLKYVNALKEEQEITGAETVATEEVKDVKTGV